MRLTLMRPLWVAFLALCLPLHDASANGWRIPVKNGLTPIGAKFVLANPMSRGVPGTAAEVALGLADYVVGRTSTHFLNMAAGGHGGVDNAATSVFGQIAAAQASVQTYTFTVDRTKIPLGYGFQDARVDTRPASSITLQCMGTPAVYVNGLVSQWVDATSQLTVSNTTAVRGGLGLAGYSASAGAGQCGSGSWRLAMHMPSVLNDANSGARASLVVANTDVTIADWDFSNLVNTVLYLGPSSYTGKGSVTLDNNIFEAAAPSCYSGVAAGGTVPGLFTGTEYPVDITNNTFLYTPYKGSPPPVTLTDIPGSLQITVDSIPCDVGVNYSVADVTDPTRLGGLIVTAVSGNTVTMKVFGDPQGIVNTSALQKGDKIQFFRGSPFDPLIAGNLRNVSNNYVEVPNDFIRTGGASNGAELSIVNNRVKLFGAEGFLHADFIQGYGYPFDQYCNPTTLCINGKGIGIHFNWSTMDTTAGVSSGGNPRDQINAGGATGYYPGYTDVSYNKFTCGVSCFYATDPVTLAVTAAVADGSLTKLTVELGADNIVQNNDHIIIKGALPAAYNGEWQISAAPGNIRTFDIPVDPTANPPSGFSATYSATVGSGGAPISNPAPIGPYDLTVNDTSQLVVGARLLTTSVTTKAFAVVPIRTFVKAIKSPTVVTLSNYPSSNTLAAGTTLTFAPVLQFINKSQSTFHDNYLTAFPIQSLTSGQVVPAVTTGQLFRSDAMGSFVNFYNLFLFDGGKISPAPIQTAIATGEYRSGTILASSWNHVSAVSLSVTNPVPGTSQFSITDDGSPRSDPVTWEYSLDGGAWTGVQATFSMTTPPAGAHVMRLHSKSAPTSDAARTMTHTGPDALFSVTVN